MDRSDSIDHRRTDPRDQAPMARSASTVPVLVGTLLVAKLVVVGTVAMNASDEPWPILIATTWHWLLVVVLLAHGALLFRWRLLRARSRRRRLLQAEWMTRADQSGPPQARRRWPWSRPVRRAKRGVRTAPVR